MQVREGMSEVVLTVGPGHTLRDAAKAMVARRVGAAVVIDPEQPGPGLITERDILSSRLTFASPSWSLEEAAAAMIHGGFRHLVVVEHGDMVGILSMRDIVRVWTGDGASCEIPPAVSLATG